MGLEHWDSSRRKYVLYQNNEQHSADCDRFPFGSIPRRVFLDTNVINVLVKHSTHVFDGEPIPPNTEPTFAIDIEAGIDLKAAFSNVIWDIATTIASVHQQLWDAQERLELVEQMRLDLRQTEIASPRPNLSRWHSRSTRASTYGSGLRKERL